MKDFISVKLAGNILIGSTAVLILIQILVMAGIVPFEMLWGGLPPEDESTMKFEIISLAVSSVFLAALAVKVGYIKTEKFSEVISLLFWVIFMYLIINAIGNLISGITFAKVLLAPVALILAFFTYRLVIDK